MAEGFFRAMAASLPDQPLTAGSAGVGAGEGLPPSVHSVTVMREEGIDITGQRSRQLTPGLVRRATHLFGMTAGHREAIRMMFPEAIEKTFVLREFLVDGDLDLDVPDPIGLGLDAYERTRNLIKEAMPSVLKFVLGQPGADLLAGEDRPS